MTLQTFNPGESVGFTAKLNADLQEMAQQIQALAALVNQTYGTPARGDASGSATASASSVTQFGGVGLANGSSSAFASSNGTLVLAQSVGTATGTATALASVGSAFVSTGTANGMAVVAANGDTSANGSRLSVGTATGSATVTATLGGEFRATGTATGSATLVAQGSRAGVGKAQGGSLAVAYSQGGAAESADGSYLSATGSQLFVSKTPGTQSASLSSIGLTAYKGSVIIDGVTDTGTSNACLLYYTSRYLYQMNVDGNWYSWGGSPGVWNTALNPLPTSYAESVEGYVLTSPADTIYASSTVGTPAASTAQPNGGGLDTFAITANPGQVKRNSVIDTSTANVKQLYYHNNAVWYLNTSNIWFQRNSSGGWTQSASTPVPNTPAINVARVQDQWVNAAFVVAGTYQDYVSTAGTYATPGNGSITLFGSIWSIDTGLNLLRDGVAIPDGANTGAIDAYNGNLFGQDNTSQLWYQWDNTNQIFNAASAPPNVPNSSTPSSSVPVLQYMDQATGTWVNFPSTTNVTNQSWKFVHPPISPVQSAYTISVRDANSTGLSKQSNSFQVYSPGVVTLTSLTLSNNSASANQPAGTVVGNLTVGTAGGTFTGGLTLSGTGASSFKVVGNQLQTAAVLNGGTYSLTITASQVNAINSPLSINVTVTVSAEAAQATSVTATGVNMQISGTPGSAGSQYTVALVNATGTGKTNYMITANGVLQTASNNVAQLYYINHTLYQRTNANAWYVFLGTATSGQMDFASCSTPIPAIALDGAVVTSVTIPTSNSSEFVSASGSSGGVLTLVSAGSPLPGVTWTLSGANASSFTLINGNTLKTTGALPAGTYTLTPNATIV